jgi:1,4-dihydroxy-2-naphthoate octaprenyltransferase
MQWSEGNNSNHEIQETNSKLTKLQYRFSGNIVGCVFKLFENVCVIVIICVCVISSGFYTHNSIHLGGYQL